MESSRHHYIPKFLINGFTNKNGLLYIYDKKKGEILKKQLPPKSVFFEWGRNTLEFSDEHKNSMLEDDLYNHMDNITSKVIKYLQTEDINKIKFKIDESAIVLFFFISLFWRIPKTDYAIDNLMKRSKINAIGIDSEFLKNNLAYRKLKRAGLFQHHVEQLKNFGTKGTKYLNLHANEKSLFVLGDFPFLFREMPNEFRKFNESDILFAVSSTRMYSSTNTPYHTPSSINSYSYNASIIEQSVRYIASGDINILKNSIDFHEQSKRFGTDYIIEAAFQTLPVKQ